MAGNKKRTDMFRLRRKKYHVFSGFCSFVFPPSQTNCMTEDHTGNSPKIKPKKFDKKD